MIRLKDVEMEYDNGTRAIKGITLTIEDGEFVFLVGPSGSGKSTIIKLMVDFPDPDGPTRKTNSPSSIRRSIPFRALVPLSYSL